MAHPNQGVAPVGSSGPANVGDRERLARERGAGNRHDLAGRAIDRADVARLCGPPAEPATLADREAMDPVVPRDLSPRLVDHPPRAQVARARKFLDHVLVATARDEADVLALGLRRDRKPEALRKSPNLVLAEATHGKERAPEFLLPEREQEVALVLGRVGRRAQLELSRPARGDARIVPGPDRPRSESGGPVPEGVELHVAVAERARVGRAAREVGVDEGFDDARREGLAEVDDVVRDAEQRRAATCVLEVVERTASRVPVGPRARGSESHRHADHLVAGSAQQGRRDGAVDAPRHRRDDAASRRQVR